jgi:ribosome recycling factor
VQPWDRSIIGSIEKALQQANLGTNPVNDGAVLRIILPPMTEERRKQLTKTVQALAEEARVAVRQQRQVVHAAVKRDTSRAEDERFTLDHQVQDAVDQTNAEIGQLAKRKEQEIMTV